MLYVFRFDYRCLPFGDVSQLPNTASMLLRKTRMNCLCGLAISPPSPIVLSKFTLWMKWEAFLFVSQNVYQPVWSISAWLNPVWVFLYLFGSCFRIHAVMKRFFWISLPPHQGGWGWPLVCTAGVNFYCMKC